MSLKDGRLGPLQWARCCGHGNPATQHAHFASTAAPPCLPNRCLWRKSHSTKNAAQRYVVQQVNATNINAPKENLGGYNAVMYLQYRVDISSEKSDSAMTQNTMESDRELRKQNAKIQIHRGNNKTCEKGKWGTHNTSAKAWQLVSLREKTVSLCNEVAEAAIVIYA